MTVHPDSLKNLAKAPRNGKKRTIRFSVGEVIKMIGNDDIEVVMAKVKEMAKGGNMPACAYILDKVTPAAPKQPPIEEEIKLEGTPAERMKQLFEVGPGVLNAPEWEAVTKSIVAEQEILDKSKLDDIERMLKSLQAKLGIEL